MSAPAPGAPIACSAHVLTHGPSGRLLLVLAHAPIPSRVAAIAGLAPERSSPRSAKAAARAAFRFSVTADVAGARPKPRADEWPSTGQTGRHDKS